MAAAYGEVEEGLNLMFQLLAFDCVVSHLVSLLHA